MSEWWRSCWISGLRVPEVLNTVMLEGWRSGSISGLLVPEHCYARRVEVKLDLWTPCTWTRLHGHQWWKIFIALPLAALHKPIQISFKNKEWTLNQNYLCDGLSSWHLLVRISVLHTHWHISKRYILSRVSFFFRLHQSHHIFHGDILVKSSSSRMLISFVMVAYSTISFLVSSHISLPRNF